MKTYQAIAGACAVFATLLASCTFEEGDGREPAFESTMTVRLSITHGQPATRAVAEGIDAAAPVEDEHTLSVGDGSGHLFFVDEGGIITKHVEILATGNGNGGNGNTTIGFDRINGTGDVIEDVPYASTHACIIMNLPTETTLTGATVGAPLLDLTPHITTEDLYDITTGGVDKMPVIGAGALRLTPGKAYNKEVELEVKGIGCRIEIREIRTQIVAYREITALKLTGIFINNYYPYLPLFFAEYPPMINAGSDTLNYSTQFYSTNHGSTLYTADYGGLGVMTGSNGNFSITAGQDAKEKDLVWGYNILPNEMIEGCLPHIVLRFNGVSVYDDHGGGPDYTITDKTRFVTVKGYNLQVDGQPLPLVVMERGYIYQIDNFVISYEELYPQPNESTGMEVTVTANVIQWTGVNVPHEL
jgi:hypothetical protein